MGTNPSLLRCSASLNPSSPGIQKSFSTFNNQLIKFREWLIKNNCQNVCMGFTGQYGIPVYNALEGHISNIVVANPKWGEAIKGEKDDNKDAKRIADLFKFGIVRSSYIPKKDIRILRKFAHYEYKLFNIRSSDDSLYAVEGTDLNHYQKVKIKIVQKYMELLDSLFDEIQHHIDMLDWLLDETNKKSVKISKAGIYLKTCLVQVAHAAVKDKICSCYAEFPSVVARSMQSQR